jgi:hypothetical protein
MTDIEATINNKLDQFTRLGKIAKKLQRKRSKNKDFIERLYKGMTMIAIELDLVKDIIFQQHPNLVPLWSSLIELYGPTLRKQDETKK